MIIVGLTGGIGSGKTTAAKLFQQLGIPVYDSDSSAKALYSESDELRTQMIRVFGSNIYLGKDINRKKLAELVFNDKAQLQKLNALVHPLLQQDFERWIPQQSGPYVIREAAILIESKAVDNCDKVIVVTADELTRINRVMKRDGVGEKNVKARISHQLTDQQRLEYADFVIDNNNTESLKLRVAQIDRELRIISN